MTYTDHYTFPASYMIDDDFKKLRNAKRAKKPQLFVEYCKKVIALKASGVMPLRDAAYVIAGTMFIRELEGPLFDEITALAGSLELPYHISGIKPAEGWDNLVQLIHKYDLRLHKEK